MKLIKMALPEEEIWTQTHTGRIPREDTGRDGGDAFIVRGTWQIARKPPEARAEVGNRLFLSTLRKYQLCWHLDLGRLASRAVRHTFLLPELPNLWYLVNSPCNGVQVPLSNLL